MLAKEAAAVSFLIDRGFLGLACARPPFKSTNLFFDAFEVKSTVIFLLFFNFKQEI